MTQTATRIPKQPQGPRQQAWFAAGYQAALADLAGQFAQGGDAAVREWIKNNRTQA